jgi:hypothetical protein
MKHLKPFYVAVLLNSCFFIAYGFQLLIDGQDFSHLSTPNGLGSSDLSGAIRMAVIYESSGFMNFKSDFTNYPDGENIFSIYLLSQFNTNLLIQLFGFLSPKIAIFLIQFIFSTITTLGILLFLNQVTKKLAFSIAIGLIHLISSFNVSNLGAHINGLLWGLPLFVLVSLYREISAIDVRRKKLVFVCLIILITDIYFCYAAIFIFISSLIFKHIYIYEIDKISDKTKEYNSLVSNFHRNNFITILISIFLLYVFALLPSIRKILDNIYGAGAFQPASPIPLNLVNISLLNSFLGLIIIFIVLNLKKFSYQDKWLFWTASLLLVFSINLGSFRGVNLSPVNVFSLFLPNLDHVQRFLPYVILIYMALAIKILIEFFEKFQLDLYHIKRVIVFVFILSTFSRIFSLLASEHVSVHSLRYEEFRKMIPIRSSILAIPSENFGRDWLQQAYLNRPLVNSLNTKETNDLVRQISVNSPSNLRKFMQSKNTSFLIMPCDYKLTWETFRNSWDDFDKNFTFVSKVKDQGYEQGSFEVCLYRI